MNWLDTWPKRVTGVIAALVAVATLLWAVGRWGGEVADAPATLEALKRHHTADHDTFAYRASSDSAFTHQEAHARRLDSLVQLQRFELQRATLEQRAATLEIQADVRAMRCEVVGPGPEGC